MNTLFVLLVWLFFYYLFFHPTTFEERWDHFFKFTDTFMEKDDETFQVHRDSTTTT